VEVLFIRKYISIFLFSRFQRLLEVKDNQIGVASGSRRTVSSISGKGVMIIFHSSFGITVPSSLTLLSLNDPEKITRPHFGLKLNVRWIGITSHFDQKSPKFVFMHSWKAFVVVFTIPLLSILNGDPIAR
jgi:hypothetical protein